jgi:hypothetical protein
MYALFPYFRYLDVVIIKLFVWFISAGSSLTTDTQIEGFQSLDASALPGRRKRKVLSGEEIASSPPAGSGAPGGWVRAALG